MKNLSRLTIFAVLHLLFACHNDDADVKTNACRVALVASKLQTLVYYYNTSTGDLDSITYQYLDRDTTVNATTKLTYNASHQLVEMIDIDTYSTFNYLPSNQTITQILFNRDSPTAVYTQDTIVFEFNPDGSLKRDYYKSSPEYYNRYEYNAQGNLKIVYTTSYFNEQETIREEFLDYDNKRFPFSALPFGELILINESGNHRSYKISTTYNPMYSHNRNNIVRNKYYYNSPDGDTDEFFYQYNEDGYPIKNTIESSSQDLVYTCDLTKL